MSFSIGIIGLPNVGKSTLFQALTKKQVAIGPFPFTTIKPNVARVPLPDQRLRAISKIVKPEKTTPTFVEFIDIAGLVKGAHRGEGLGNQFLAHLQACQLLLEVVRAFKQEEVINVEKTIDPERDIKIVEEELIQKDLKIAERAIEDYKKESKAGKKDREKLLPLLEKIIKNLKERRKIKELSLSLEELSQIRQYQFLTVKPIIYILNIDSSKPPSYLQKFPGKAIDLKWEQELSALSEKELKEMKVHSLLDQVLLKCYNELGLITFYTIAGGKEVRAWRIKKGTKAPQAGGKVHSDFKEKFIRAEILPWQELLKAGSWKNAKEKGLVKTVGKEYVVQDGEIIEFKI